MALSESVSLVTSAARAEFFAEFNKLPDHLAQVAYTVSSVEQIELLAWLGDVPSMRKWTGERVHKAVPELKFSVVNELYEGCMDFDFFTFSSPRGGTAVKAKATQQAGKAQGYPYRKCMEMLNAGDTVKCYDGQPLFSASHVDPGASNKTAQSNIVAVSSVTDARTPTAAKALEALRAIFAKFMSLKDGEGDEFYSGDGIGSYKPLIVCPPEYSSILTQLQTNATVFDGSSSFSNEMVGRFTAFPSTRLSSPTANSGAFYALLVDSAQKPFVFTEHTPVTLSDNADDVISGKEKILNVYVTSAFGLAPGQWRCAVKATLNK